jgi:hypothetical protein
MIEIKNPVRGVADREKWAARGASFVAKAKATKAVWFPPTPVETGKKAGATAKKATSNTTGAAKKTTKNASGKSAGAAKKTTTSATRKPRKKANGAARKTTSSAGKR